MKFQTAAIFSNHMVLQRHKPIAIFGTGEDGMYVTAVLNYEENGQHFCYEGNTIISGGRWLLYLPPLSEKTACTLSVTCENITFTYHNVAIGEVWLCGGQSNMEFELQNIIGGDTYLSEDKPNVRFYNVLRKSYIDDSFYMEEAQNSWQEFDSNSARTWSGVGYLYGKQLSEKLGVTVGLIGCNWGGTSASAWMSKEYLASDEGTFAYLADYEKAAGGKDEAELIRRYEEYLVYEKEWTKKCDALYAAVPDISWEEVQNRIGICLWPGPMCARHPFRPGGLYETMIQRIVPYTMRGFTYYQGESDDHKPYLYARLMELLIRQWRSDWQDDSMPFLYVQLPGHRYIQDEDRKNWCILRKMQEQVSATVPNTGMAVLIDAGEFNDIHPKNKAPVADRLYRQALYHVYGGITEEEACAPLFDSCEIYEDHIRINFKHVFHALVIKGDSKDNDTLTGFEAAGKDNVYHPVSAHIEGTQVVVDTSGIIEPAAVRYLWTNYPEYEIRLYNQYGLPAAPFESVKDNAMDKEYEPVIHEILELN